MAVKAANAARTYLIEAGLDAIPPEWGVIDVASLLAEDRGISVGVMYPGEHYPQGVPLIKAGDLNGNVINPFPDFRISPEKHTEYRRTELQGGEILMTLVGDVGSCAVVPQSMAGWNTARAVAVIRLKHASDAHFVACSLRSPAIRHIMDVWCNTTVQATLNLKEIKQIPLPWPSKHERDAIARILGALDDKIELNRRRNRTLEAMTRAIFQSWFVDFDPVKAKAAGRTPPGLSPALAALFPDSLIDSPLGPIPSGWRVGKVRDACLRVENGGTPKRQIEEYWKPAEVPWLTSGEVRQQFVVETENYISASGLKNSSTKIWPPFTTVVALYGATAGIATMLGVELCANQACCGLIPRDSSACFVHQTLSGSLASLQQQARGSAQQNLSQSIVADFQCVIPPVEILQFFESEVHPLYQRSIEAIRESRTLAALRDALLPKLISGELRVPDAERIVGRAV